MHSTLDQFNKRRLDDLDDNLQQTQRLLKSYEDALLYEINPRLQMGYQREIEKLKEKIAEYQREYTDLLRTIATPELTGQLADVGKQLEALDAKMDSLLAGQGVIRTNLADLRATIVAGFDEKEQAIITSIVEKLNQSQLLTTHTIEAALKTGRISQQEQQATLAVVQQALTAIQERGASLQHLPKETAGQLTALLEEPTLDMSHKLSVTLPIIPFILSYQADIGLQHGLNLKAAWERLVAKARGEQKQGMHQ